MTRYFNTTLLLAATRSWPRKGPKTLRHFDWASTTPLIQTQLCLRFQGRSLSSIPRQKYMQTNNTTVSKTKHFTMGSKRESKRTASDYLTRPYDLVVFGATGITGQYVLEELVKGLDTYNSELSIAVAGRNKERLQKVIEQVSDNCGKCLQSVPILVADSRAEHSLAEMCKSSKVLLNCVGPYYIHGEPVVKACIQNGTHHLDVSGEPLFSERMHSQYNEAARESGVYLIGGCGSPNVLNDLGVDFVKRSFKGDIDSIDSFLKVDSGQTGLCYNATTLHCALHGFANEKELRLQRKQPSQYPVSTSTYRSKPKKAWFSSDVSSWCVLWPSSDRSIIKRSIKYDLEVNKRKPLKIGVYICGNSLLDMILMVFYGYCVIHLAKVSFFRQCISKYPGVFTNGKFKIGGPSREQVEHASFSISLIAKGWIDTMANHKSPPDRRIVVQITGPELAYATTAICVVQCGITLLKERENMPKGGGVFTTASAFSNTDIIKRLQDRNIKFAIINEQQLQGPKNVYQQ